MEIVLKKGFRIGFLSAEQDSEFLKDNFLDSGLIEIVKDTKDPRFILLGRTGAGKTAIVQKLESVENTSKLNPEELSFQYLCNSNVIQFLNQTEANFDIFYKFLWKHIFILELIRIRYESVEEVDDSLFNFFDISKFIKKAQSKKQNETKEAARKYFEKYADKYWISTDTRIKNITDEIEEKVSADSELKSDFDFFQGKHLLNTDQDENRPLVLKYHIV